MRHLEQRSYQTELRLAGDNGRSITGCAIVYNSRSEDLGGFVEIVSPGALAKTLAASRIKLLFDHDSGHVLGSIQAKTLSLTDTERGLEFQCDPPETTWANDLLVSLNRGDINQCSFGFNVVNDKWEKVNGVMVRTLQEIDVFEISIVAFPAYPASSVSVRSKDEFQKAVDAFKATSDQETPADADAIQQQLDTMRRRLELASK
jgi:HK97 family phage prohead protease